MGLATGSGKPVAAGQRLAAGGQGEVFAVPSHPGMVLKRYLPASLASDASLEQRLQAMTDHPPEHWREASSGHLTVAWPAQLVYDAGTFCGFLMPQVDMTQTVGLHRITNPTDRHTAAGPTRWARSFTWRYLVTTAANLAQATAGLHTAGVVIGDFNDANIRAWRRARVTLLDTDSMQIADGGTGGKFLCRVGRPEFTPPELAHADWATTVRQSSSDLFALAIHIYQLLLEGEHPFRGSWHGSGDKPPVSQLAAGGIWANHGSGPLTPRRAAIPATLLPPDILDLFRRAFEDGATSPDARPTATTWHTALTHLATQLITCTTSRDHIYPATNTSCPWCAYTPPPAPVALQRAAAAEPARPALAPATAASAQTPRTQPAASRPAPLFRYHRRRQSSPIWALVGVLFIAGLLLFSMHGGSDPSPVPYGPLPPFPPTTPPPTSGTGPPPVRTVAGDSLTSVTSVAFSPAGTTLATGDGGSLTPRLWNAATGAALPALASLPAPPQNADSLPQVTSVAFSRNGTMLAAASNDVSSAGIAAVWNLATRTVTTTMTDPHPVSSSVTGDPPQLTSLAFSPDSATIAAGDDQGSIYLWSAATGQLTATLTQPDSKAVSSVAFSPSGTSLATADDIGHAYVWNLPARHVTTTISDSGQADGGQAVAYSPDGTMLATSDGQVTSLWNPATGQLIRQLTGAPDPQLDDDDTAPRVAFSPAGTSLAAGNDSGYVRVWDTTTGSPVATFRDPNTSPLPDLRAVAFSADGTLLAAADGGEDGAYLWQLANPGPSPSQPGPTASQQPSDLPAS